MTKFENFFFENEVRFNYLYKALNDIVFTQLPGDINKNHEYYIYKNDDYLFELNNKNELIELLKKKEYKLFFDNFNIDIFLITGGKTGSSYFKELCKYNNINIFKMTEGDYLYKILLFFGIPPHEHKYINAWDIFMHFKYKNENILFLDIIRLPLDRSISSWFYNNFYKFANEYDKINNYEYHMSIKNDIHNNDIFDCIINTNYKNRMLYQERYYGIFPHNNFEYFKDYLLKIVDNFKYVLIKFEDIANWHIILSKLLNIKINDINIKINDNDSKPWGLKYKQFKNYIRHNKIVFSEGIKINQELLKYYDTNTIYNYLNKYNFINTNNNISFNFKYIKNFISLNEIKEIQKNIQDTGGYNSNSHDTEKWGRKYNRSNFYNILGNKLLNKIEEITNETNLRFEYGFAAKYNINGKLDPHYDNWNNYISCSICLNNLKEEWPLYLHTKKWNNPYSWRQTILNIEKINKEDIYEFKLKPGDIGIFSGRNHLHWRNNMDNETEIVLLHYTKKNELYYEKTRTEPDGIYNTYTDFLNSKCYVNNLTIFNNLLFFYTI